VRRYLQKRRRETLLPGLEGAPVIGLDLGHPPLVASFRTSSGRRRFGTVPYPPPRHVSIPCPPPVDARRFAVGFSVSPELLAFPQETLELERIRPRKEGGPCADYVPQTELAVRRMGAACDAAMLAIQTRAERGRP